MKPTHWLVAWLLASTALAATAQDQAVTVTDFRAGPGEGSYAFASRTPRNGAELMNPKAGQAVMITGKLLLPPAAAGADRLPAVVLLHGSGGVYPELSTFWGKGFTARGYAVFILDMFGPRGVQSTAENQAAVPIQADYADAYAALALLATHPRLDAARIALMGFSRGGTTAWRNGVVRIAQAAGPAGLRYAAHLPVYATCSGSQAVAVKPGVFGPAPMLFIHGEDDDYAYASACKALAQRLQAAGTPAEYLGLPGARHKFDADNPKRFTLPRVTKVKADCPFEYDFEAGRYRDQRNGDLLTIEKAVPLLRGDLCAATGASVEGDGKSREAAFAAADAFLSKVFKR